MTDLTYWQTYAKEMAQHDRPVPVMPTDLLRLVEHATNLQATVQHLEAENRRLERLVANGGHR